MLFIYAGFRPRIFCSTFEDTDLVRTAHEPTSKVRSHHAAHVPARSQYVQKKRLHCHPLSITSFSSELE